MKDELLQIDPILIQLMVQLRESELQFHESARQQQRFEVALLDFHSELQHFKSDLCCSADHSALCAECAAACSGRRRRKLVEYKFSHVSKP